MMTKEEKIEYCIEHFDFDKVKKVMDFLEWRWWNGSPEGSFGVPSTIKIFRYAQDKLEETYSECEFRKKDFFIESGGLIAEAFYYPEEEGGIYLKLSFVLTSINVG